MKAITVFSLFYLALQTAAGCTFCKTAGAEYAAANGAPSGNSTLGTPPSSGSRGFQRVQPSPSALDSSESFFKENAEAAPRGPVARIRYAVGIYAESSGE